MQKRKPAVGNFKQICRYVESHSQEAMMKKAFEMYLERNNIPIPENDLSRYKSMYNQYRENAYLGKFKSQFVGGGRLEDSIADVKENLEQYIHIYEILSDEKSKKTLYHYLHYYLFGDMTKLDEVYAGETQYYLPNLLPIRDHQVLVDCGAYRGETVIGFIQIYGSYDRIYAYEPDPDNHEYVEQNLADYPNIVAFNRAVSDKAGVMRFTSHMPKTANRFNPEGDKVVPISTIDRDIKDKITFLKMDIESAEPNALRGAKRHIVEDKPDLAICVYHTIPDIRTIPEQIYEMNPNQSFYLRHHSRGVAEETVFYAHPMEKT